MPVVNLPAYALPPEYSASNYNKNSATLWAAMNAGASNMKSSLQKVRGVYGASGQGWRPILNCSSTTIRDGRYPDSATFSYMRGGGESIFTSDMAYRVVALAPTDTKKSAIITLQPNETVVTIISYSFMRGTSRYTSFANRGVWGITIHITNLEDKVNRVDLSKVLTTFSATTSKFDSLALYGSRARVSSLLCSIRKNPCIQDEQVGCGPLKMTIAEFIQILYKNVWPNGLPDAYNMSAYPPGGYRVNNLRSRGRSTGGGVTMTQHVQQPASQESWYVIGAYGALQQDYRCLRRYTYDNEDTINFCLCTSGTFDSVVNFANFTFFSTGFSHNNGGIFTVESVTSDYPVSITYFTAQGDFT